MTVAGEPVSLAFWDLGPRDGEPWLLVHGLGSLAVSWDPVLRALRRDCRLLVPELSALGGTRAPEGGLTIPQGAEALARLLDAELGGRPATVAGLSLGGWIAVRLALARPDLVGRLLLVDSGGYRDQDWNEVLRLVSVEDLAGVDRLYRAMFRRTPWIMRRSRRAFLEAYTSPGVMRILQETREEDTFGDADLLRLTMPTALIWGEHDGLFTLETGRAMAAAIPGATLEVLPDCGHAGQLECPRRLVEAVQRFRERTRAEASSATILKGAEASSAPTLKGDRGSKNEKD